MRLVVVLLLAACKAHAPADGAWLLDAQRLDKLKPDAIVARIAPRETDTVADVGAGPGAFVPAWSRVLSHGALIATDVRADYLARVPALPNVQTRLVTTTTTGLADSSVDVIFLCQVDQLFADRRAMLELLTHALRPHGRIVIVNVTRDLEPLAAATAQWHEVDAWQPADGFFARSYVAR